jgi:hypothetical protein
MKKFKMQRIWSKSSGIRHKMVFTKDSKYFIKVGWFGSPRKHQPFDFCELIHIDNDLWKLK